ncbi:hypothetical protein [Actinosynnema sp. NPDC020468]|uniref:hypothetical protein n=1 Tax=Actinosynnema sp. NPDC020468 TaxID=3154488 RepID=UPI00340EA364
MSRRVLGAVLLAVSGVLAVLGSFLPEYRAVGLDPSGGFSVSVTAWEVTVSPPADGIGSTPQLGVPLVVAALVLAAAAGLVALPEHQRSAARYAAVGGTGLLLGAVASVLAVAVEFVSDGGDQLAGRSFEVGLWVLLLAPVVAGFGTVLIHAPRAVAGSGPVVHVLDDLDDDDTSTPPFGIAVSRPDVVVLPESSPGEEKP